MKPSSTDGSTTDIQVVRNVVIGRWSDGQTEGRINRLKTLKPPMFGRADTEPLRAKLLHPSARSPITLFADDRDFGQIVR